MNYHSAVMNRFLAGRRMTAVKNGDTHLLIVEHLDGTDEVYFIFRHEYDILSIEMVNGDGFELDSYETGN